jgi:hypothetical protein
MILSNAVFTAGCGCQPGLSKINPADSCSDVFDNNAQASPGFYWIRSSRWPYNSVLMYCTINPANCGGEGVWMRIGYLNTVAQKTAECPGSLVEEVVNRKRLCKSQFSACVSAHFDSLGKRYRQVCGMARGYQYYSINAFNSGSIDDIYVEGVSFTYGSSPRRHLWSYAVGQREIGSSSSNCPCSTSSATQPPSFVGEHYYCESGKSGSGSPSQVWYTSNPLWNGYGNCAGTCCDDSNQPWFRRSVSSTSNLELRLCTDGGDEAVGIDRMELYIRVE